MHFRYLTLDRDDNAGWRKLAGRPLTFRRGRTPCHARCGGHLTSSRQDADGKTSPLVGTQPVERPDGIAAHAANIAVIE